MNLVLDTNELISAFIAKGVCHTVVEQCFRIHSVIASEFIISELREKFTEKFKYSNQDLSLLNHCCEPRCGLSNLVP